jgi:hypothetical protein
MVRQIGLMVLMLVLMVGMVGTVHAQLASSPGTIDNPPIIVTHKAIPNTNVQVGDIVTYEFVAQVHHGEGAGNVIITVPYNPSVLQFLDGTQFSQEEAWITSNENGFLKIETGRVGKGRPVTVMVRAKVLSGATLGSRLTGRVTYTWYEGQQRRIGRSNLPLVSAGQVANHQSYYTFTPNTSVAPVAVNRSFQSQNIFFPYEPVQLWYNTPQGHTIELGRVGADVNGVVAVEITTDTMFDGSYSIVAHGVTSNFTAIGTFEIGE